MLAGTDQAAPRGALSSGSSLFVSSQSITNGKVTVFRFKADYIIFLAIVVTLASAFALALALPFPSRHF